MEKKKTTKKKISQKSVQESAWVEIYPFTLREAMIDGFKIEKHNASVLVRGITLEFGKHEQGYKDIVKYAKGEK